MTKTYRLIKVVDNRIGASYRGRERFFIQKRILWFWWKETDECSDLREGMFMLGERRLNRRREVEVLHGDVVFIPERRAKVTPVPVEATDDLPETGDVLDW